MVDPLLGEFFLQGVLAQAVSQRHAMTSEASLNSQTYRLKIYKKNDLVNVYNAIKSDALSFPPFPLGVQPDILDMRTRGGKEFKGHVCGPSPP